MPNANRDCSKFKVGESIQFNSEAGRKTLTITEACFSGGFGEVWKAVRADADVTVAVKALKSSATDPRAKRRLDAEIKFYQRPESRALSHILPSFLGAHIAIEPEWFVLEWIDGNRLCDCVTVCTAEGPTARLQFVIEKFLLVAQAVQGLHEQGGAVHRDLKPHNVLVRRSTGKPVLIDFGFVEYITGNNSTDDRHDVGAFGTSYYMAPEVLVGTNSYQAGATTAAEVFSLGVMLFEALAGALPFDLKTDYKGSVYRSSPGSPASKFGALADDAKAAHLARLSISEAELLRFLDGNIQTVLLHALQEQSPKRYRRVALLVNDLKTVLRSIAPPSADSTMPTGEAKASLHAPAVKAGDWDALLASSSDKGARDLAQGQKPPEIDAIRELLMERVLPRLDESDHRFIALETRLAGMESKLDLLLTRLGDGPVRPAKPSPKQARPIRRPKPAAAREPDNASIHDSGPARAARAALDGGTQQAGEETPERLFVRSAELFNGGRFIEAWPLLQRLLSTGYATLPVLRMAAWCAPREGELPDLADELHRRAIDADPKHANTLGNYANFLKNVRGDHEKAEEMYRRAIDADPKHANNLGNYAALLLSLGRIDEGRALLARAFAALDPNAPSPLDLECRMYQFCHGSDPERTAALAIIKRLITTTPLRTDTWDFSGVIKAAKAAGHPQGRWLEPLAEVLAGRAEAETLADWPVWAGA